MKNINVAVIGVGNMGQHHARIYSSLPNVNLVGVCDVDIKRASNIAQKYNCLYSSDYRKFLHKENVDAVSVVVPTALHGRVACDVLEMGIHVLLEKPIATSLSEAQKIIDVAKKNKKILMVGHIERFNPAVVRLKKLIKKGALGKIVSINIKRVGGLPAQIKSNNVILDLAVHDIDISNYLLEEDPVRVYGLKSENITFGQEDSAVMLLQYDKASVVIEVNWVTPVKIRTLDITGTEGFAKLDYINQAVTLYKNKSFNKSDFIRPIKNSLKIKKSEPLKRELEYFINCVRNGKTPDVDGMAGFNALRTALKI